MMANPPAGSVTPNSSLARTGTPLRPRPAGNLNDPGPVAAVRW